jgi:hypothetical protein
MSITGQQAADLVRHALHGEPAGRTAIELANDAGVLLMAMREWRWAIGTQKDLPLSRVVLFDSGAVEPQIGETVTGATSGATGTVTDVLVRDGTWAGLDAEGYLYLSEIVGEFEAESLDGSDSGAGFAASLGADLEASHVLLPADFRALLNVEHVPGNLGTIHLTSIGDLASRRSNYLVGGPPYQAAVVWNHDALGAPRAILELFPLPASGSPAAVRIWYTRGWADLTESAVEAKVPRFIEPLYMELVRAVARGFEDDLEGPGKQSEYLAAVRSGALWLAAVQQDSLGQPTFGPPRSGFLGDQGMVGTSYTSTAVEPL